MISGGGVPNTFTTLTISGMTVGSVLFAGTGGLVSQDNTNFFWNASTAFLGVGTNSALTTFFGLPRMEIKVTSGIVIALLHKESADNLGPVFTIVKRRSGFSLLSANDFTGIMNFEGADGTATKITAQIYSQVEGVPAAGILPGRLMFSTSDSAGVVNERVRIDSGGNVGIGGTANANALLDVSSTTKAFMPPRMTTTQKNAIASPTAGMVVYDSTLNKLAVYTGAAWEAVVSV